METLIELVSYAIMGAALWGGLFMISCKTSDVQEIARKRRDEKIKTMLDVGGEPVQEQREEFTQAQEEYGRDLKTADHMGVAMIVMFILSMGFILS